MAAELIVWGEPAAGVGGEFERECARILRDGLPDGYVIATNVHLGRSGGGFYECDVVIAAPGLCDILEMKCIRPEISVGEDLITSSTGFPVDRVFSTLDLKAKVLASRRRRSPFLQNGRSPEARVNSQVVVPSEARIRFDWPDHRNAGLVKTLAETVDKYRKAAGRLDRFNDSIARKEIHNTWMAYRDASSKQDRRTSRHLGRFTIRRQLPTLPGAYEYFAVDEPPCKMEVHLREFPFDPVLPARELEPYLQEIARETRIVMKVRHPYVACVIGHFQTGASWVQVSDWFDGEELEDLWPTVAEMSSGEKVNIFIKVIQALQYCHEKGRVSP